MSQIFEQDRNLACPDPVKTGGIIINPEDALPSMRDQIHTDSKTHTTYALLKPASQNKENNESQHKEFKREIDLRDPYPRDPVKTGGILIDPQDALPHMRDQIKNDGKKSYAMLKPYSERVLAVRSLNQLSGSQTFEHETQSRPDLRSSQLLERNFAYEYTIEGRGEREPVKTGGIVIRPEDASSPLKNRLKMNQRSNFIYANLKPWTQIIQEQGGIVHGGRGARVSSELREGNRKFSYEFSREQTKQDRVKTGGIIINPEDALPSMRDQIHTHERSHATYATLKPWGFIRDEQGGVVHAANSLNESFVSSRTAELSREQPREEPIKTGGILIDKQDALPSRQNELKEGELNRVQLHPKKAKKGDSVNRGSAVLEIVRKVQQQEPVKTGGIVIDPKDVLAENRDALNYVPNSNTVYAQLKPWSKIQKEQGGVVHGKGKQRKADAGDKENSENVNSQNTFLTALNSKLDSILMKSRNFLSESSVHSSSGAENSHDVRGWGANSFMAF